MPSVTEITVPWVRTSDLSARLWIRVRIKSLISEGFSCCMAFPIYLVSVGTGRWALRSAAPQSGIHRIELASHGSVYDLVPDAHSRTANELLVKADLGPD